MRRARFEIRCAWNGDALAPGESARVELELDRAIVIRVEAAFHDDPPPPSAPGPTDGLWEHEVVELFLLGEDEHYLEVELGPHGHHLGLRLEGRRRIVERGFAIDYRAIREDDAWRGEARLGLEWLPTGLRAANAYAIHGVGPARRHLAMHAVPGPAPDFHRLECFAPLRLERA